MCLVHLNEFLILSLNPAEPDWGSVPALSLGPLSLKSISAFRFLLIPQFMFCLVVSGHSLAARACPDSAEGDEGQQRGSHAPSGIAQGCAEGLG